MQVVVLGMHRSGTSAVARVLNLMGLYFGAEGASTGRNPENPKGFWERRDVRDVNDEVLHRAGCDWDCVSGLDAEHLLRSASKEQLAIVADIVLSMDAHRPWFVKEPRLCVLLPIWKSALETPVCLHVFRNPLETAYSLQARNGTPIDVGLALWEVYNARALEASSGLPRLFLSYEDLLTEPLAKVDMLREALVRQGGYDLRSPSRRELDLFLDAALHRQRSSAQSLRAFATESQIALYQALNSAEDGAETLDTAPAESALGTLRQYERGIDVPQRWQRARSLRQQRSPSNTRLQLALRSLELKHEVASRQEASARSEKLEREYRKLVEQQRQSEKAASRRERSLDVLRERLEQAVSARWDRERAIAQLQTKERDLERTVGRLQATLEDRRKTERLLKQSAAERLQAALDERRRSEQLLKQNAEDRLQAKERERKQAIGRLQEAAEERRRSEQLLKQSAEDRLQAKERERKQAIGRLQEAAEERRMLKQSAGEAASRERKLQRTNGRLQTELEDKLNSERMLKRRNEDAASQAALRRLEIKNYTTRLEVEIKARQAQLAEAKELASRLSEGIELLLGSKRWRIGNRLVWLLLLFRRGATASEVLGPVVAKHQARLDTARHLGGAAEHLTRDLARYLPDQTQAGAQLVKSSVERSRRLTQMSTDRTLAAARLQVDVYNTIAHLDDLKEAVALVRHSKRWRLGHFLLSLPRRLIGRRPPATIADSMDAGLTEYDNLLPALQALAAPIESLPSDTPPAKESPPTKSKGAKPVQPVASPAVVSASVFASTSGFASTSVDVVVCVHNAIDDTRRCLASVRAKSSVDHRLIVVNDGSDEETTTMLREWMAKGDVATLLETHGPLGYTHAANIGLRASTAPFVVLLNSDTVVPRLWLEDMLACMFSDEAVGIVGPLSNAASWQSVPERSGSDGGWAVNQLPDGYSVDEFGELVRLCSQQRFPRVDLVNGFCLMIRRQVIERIGYLDEAAFPRGYGEEDDYCLRARAAGFQLAIADQGFVYHAKSKSFGSASRAELVRQGAAALRRKHGQEVIEQCTERLKQSSHLQPIRDALRRHLQAGTDASRLPGQATVPHGTPRQEDCKALFLLPVRGGSGGAHSVVQEVLGMRALGIDAKVATRARHAEEFSRSYGDEMQGDDWAVFYKSEEELLAQAESFDVVVATIWTSVAMLAPMAARWPDKLYAYYVQDYEPWFYEEGTEYHKGAAQSYTLLAEMTLMAKTDWLCRTVRERHDVEVFRVAPSLDHAVYYPAEAPPAADGATVIAAMIRPATPRRGPLRTLRVLRRIAEESPSPVRFVLFGCETPDLRSYVERQAPDFKLDFQFHNRGVLNRRQVADVLRAADIFVDFSDYQAFGRTGLEAMACGCATVLPEHGGVHEYAIDGDNARIVDTRSIDAMTSALHDLISDGARRERIRDRALRTARRYSISRAALSELSVFRLAKSLADRGEQASALRPESYRRVEHVQS